MANWQLVLPHVSKWEGELSSDPTDGCAKKPSSIINTSGKYKGYPFHTNRGICYGTWLEVAPKLGFNTSSQAWYNMTDAQWRSVIKNIFWDSMSLDNLRSQKIAELLLETRWMSGAGGARPLARHFQKLVGASVDGDIGNNTIAAANKYMTSKQKEDELYNSLWKFRYNQLDELGQQGKFTKYRDGWLNRMNALFERSTKLISENPITFTGIGLLVLVGVGYGVYKYLETKTA